MKRGLDEVRFVVTYPAGSVAPWADFVKRISVAGFPIAMAHRVDEQFYLKPPELSTLVLALETKDRATRERTTIYSSSRLPALLGWERGAADQVAATFLFEAYAGLLRHELAEHFMLDGHRIFDPHAHERAPTP